MRACRFLAAASLLGTLCLLAACAGHPKEPAPAAASAPPPLTAPYATAARAGAKVYRLDAGASHVQVLVDKAGPLSGLGHRHVVTVGGLRGFAEFDGDGKGRADLRFPVTALVVDPAAAKKIYPHYSAPSDEDVAGTRKHMLGPVLDSRRYPWVRLHIQGAIDGAAPRPTAVITLHGVSRKVALHGDFSRSATRLTAQGAFSLKQSDFGITPYSILMGALRVKDTLRIRYHLAFDAWCPAPSSGTPSKC